MSRHGSKHAGFTIVELMIAMTVLAVILLISSVLITNIGRLYYKGINQSQTQNTARSIGADLTQSIQLNGTQPSVVSFSNASGNFTSLCIGADRYTYVLDRQLTAGTNPINHVLWRDKNPSSGSCSALSAFPTVSSTTGTELMQLRSRLAAFSVTPTNDVGPYHIVITIAYGDTDLLITAPDGTVMCRGSSGDQYCATASLDTAAIQRLY